MAGVHRQQVAKEKVQRSRLEILLKGSTLNRFLEEAHDATIQVGPLDSVTQ
ncbi:MAG TPA: hypothetical protein VFO31_02785 [Vicinamibacterales bacterium]|nr:hypothetical protein [Vicinamibacterales bacterium]